MRARIGSLVVCVLLAWCASPLASAAPRPRNVVLMIGDGMGLAQVSAGMVVAGGRLNLERCPVVGLAKTQASDSFLTDSAAAATALATGVKSYNTAIGVGPDRKPVRTILELAEARGLRTGLVVTCSLTHATPAAFAAHQPHRNMEEEIAADLARAKAEVLIGGGRRFFTQRKDGRNLLEEMRAGGYRLLEDPSRLAEAAGTPLAAVVADLQLPKLSEGRGDYLPRAVDTALRLLRGGKGFFLMTEGSQIDWGSHDNDGDYAAGEMVDFDQAIGRALDFAARDGNTLVVITADHETGGLAILGGSPEAKTLRAGFVTKGHTGIMVPVFAYGPGSPAFAGVYENTEIFRKMRAALGL